MAAIRGGAKGSKAIVNNETQSEVCEMAVTFVIIDFSCFCVILERGFFWS